MKIPSNALVLVADGRKMLFLRNHGDADLPDLRVEEHHQQDNPADRDQKSDKQGNSTSSTSLSRDTHEETDYHQLAEDRFAGEAAEMLRRRALANDFDKLIVVAPPRTLGELRKRYHKEVQSRLHGEVDKDLTGRPVVEIEKLLA